MGWLRLLLEVQQSKEKCGRKMGLEEGGRARPQTTQEFGLHASRADEVLKGGNELDFRKVTPIKKKSPVKSPVKKKSTF